MNHIEKAVVEIIRELVSGIPADIPTEIEWNEIYSELEKQAVVEMACKWVRKKYSDNLNVQAATAYTLAHQIARWCFLMDKQDEIISILQKEGYHLAVMKGSANGAFYPVPELRHTGDIDLLVPEEHYEEIAEFLQKKGYCASIDYDKGKHHIEFVKEGVIFEIHKRPGGTARMYSEYNKQLIDFFQKGLETVEYVYVKEYRFPILPRLQNGIMLLLHTISHLRRGIGLRNLIDWMVYVDHNMTNDYWYNEFEIIAERYHVCKLAKTMTRTCQIYLGLRTDLNFCHGIEDRLCDQLINYFVQQGEFGAKAGNEDKGVRFLLRNRSIRDVFMALDRSSLMTIPYAKKNILLRPVAWTYQCIRYLKGITGREKLIQSIADDFERAKEREELFKEMEIEFRN